MKRKCFQNYAGHGNALMACQHVLCWVKNIARCIMLTHGSHLPMASIFGKWFTWAMQTITLQFECNISSALSGLKRMVSLCINITSHILIRTPMIFENCGIGCNRGADWSWYFHDSKIPFACLSDYQKKNRSILTCGT